MGVPDITLFTILALADVSLVLHLHVRRQRRNRAQRMMRSLRAAAASGVLAWQQAA